MNAIEKSFERRLDDLKIITLTDGEIWSARDLMPYAGYTNWRKWSGALDRAIASVNASGLNAADHFVGGVKMVEVGSGARREVEDVELTRYACYILFQNADARKPEIAAAQQYFAVKTRQAEAAPSAPDLSTPQGVLEMAQLLTKTAEDLVAANKKIAIDAPKVAYVDEFVSGRDVRLFRNVAKCLGMKESELRDDLLDRKWIYCETIERYSKSQKRDVEVNRYSAYADKTRYFYPAPNHDAPRFKGEAMHTLKITPRGAIAIAKLYGVDPEVVDDPGPDLVAV